jgi:hypothetical protein
MCTYSEGTRRLFWEGSGLTFTTPVHTMAPKNKGKGKAKSRDEAGEDMTSPKLKSATSINVRHILVFLYPAPWGFGNDH